jgi:hypothetical protein
MLNLFGVALVYLSLIAIAAGTVSIARPLRHQIDVDAETDRAYRRVFAAYWRVIYPGSALIRRMWLRAVKRRAESPVGQAGVVAGPAAHRPECPAVSER